MTDGVVAMKMGGRWTEFEKQKIKKISRTGCWWIQWRRVGETKVS